MVIDDLKNAALYCKMDDRIAKAFKYLQESDFSKVEPGKHEIDGTNIYALVQSYETAPVNESEWESHDRYIDVQYVADGTELLGYINRNQLKVVKEYDKKDDYTMYEGKGNYLTLDKGMFMIFAPQDAHMPCRTASAPGQVMKVVVKVLAE